jgi:hypothetical protein
MPADRACHQDLEEKQGPLQRDIALSSLATYNKIIASHKNHDQTNIKLKKIKLLDSREMNDYLGSRSCCRCGKL